MHERQTIAFFLAFVTQQALLWGNVERVMTYIDAFTPFDDDLRGVVRLYVKGKFGFANEQKIIECQYTVRDIQTTERAELLQSLATQTRNIMMAQ